MEIWATRSRPRLIVPIRFRRAITGVPQAEYPDIDDRGERPGEYGPIVGVTEGATIRVHVVRAALPNEVPLFATAGWPPRHASHASHASTTSPPPFDVTSGAALDATTPMEVALHGVHGGTHDHQDGRLEIRAGSASGPILAHLTVRVFVPLPLTLRFHRVRFQNASGDLGPEVRLDSAALTATARIIWGHYGIVVDGEEDPGPPLLARIQLTDGAPADWTFDMRNWDGIRRELPPLLHARWVAGKANVYLVSKVAGPHQVGQHPVAVGIGRRQTLQERLPHMSMIVSDGDPDVRGRTAAHELGHFLGLEHVGEAGNDPHRVDPTVFALRQLMHNYRLLHDPDSWPAERAWRSRARVGEVGYGRTQSEEPPHPVLGRRGTLLTLKEIPHVAGDNQVATAREEVRRGFV
jgi:hypothetical protein